MESSEKQHFHRGQMATRLRQIADMIETGKVQVGDVSVAMPDDLEYELDLEEKHDKGELEIDLSWKR